MLVGMSLPFSVLRVSKKKKRSYDIFELLLGSGSGYKCKSFLISPRGSLGSIPVAFLFTE